MDNVIEINLSKLICAPQWKVIRMLTRVGDFPQFVPTVREASVVKRHKNLIYTKWRIKVDSIPIQWLEADTLDLGANAIYFRAIGGDFQEFRGRWQFLPHHQGTQVTLTAYLEVDIPVIRDFAREYLGKMLTRNFQAILDSFERRLVSSRYQSYKSGKKDKIAGFAVIGHLYNFYHLEKSLKLLNPGFKMPSREFLGHLFNISPSFKMYDILGFKSKTGESVNGCFIVATFIPDMIEKDVWAIFSKVVKACKIAEKNGVGIVTLGGFTSIVSEKVGHEISSEVDVPVTTGNSFTSAMAIDGVLKAVELLGRDISTMHMAIVGGTGDIGSACGRVFVDKVKHLTITGRTKENLVKIKAELARRKKASVTATLDNETAARTAEIIISAASATSSILQVDWFKPGAIICDIGYPKNISYSPTTRNDILVFSGGLAKTPSPISLPIDLGLPDASTLYGCFSEAIILSLEKRYENYSFGRGNITPERIDLIRQMGAKHGFEASDFYWGNRRVDKEFIEQLRNQSGKVSLHA